MTTRKRKSVGKPAPSRPQVVARIRNFIRVFELFPCDLGFKCADTRYDNLSYAKKRSMSAEERQLAWDSAALYSIFQKTGGRGAKGSITVH